MTIEIQPFDRSAVSLFSGCVVVKDGWFRRCASGEFSNPDGLTRWAGETVFPRADFQVAGSLAWKSRNEASSSAIGQSWRSTERLVRKVVEKKKDKK